MQEHDGGEMISWYKEYHIDDICILICEKNDLTSQEVEETEPMMKPYRNRSESWDYRSASALVYAIFNTYHIPLELYRETDDGRPFLAGGRGDFSISHSGNFTALAFTSDSSKSIGIDIEEIERAFKKDVSRLADRFFSEEEYLAVRKSHAPILKFLELWTRKEALMKSLRIPLSRLLKEEKTVLSEWTAGRLVVKKLFEQDQFSDKVVGSLCYYEM